MTNHLGNQNSCLSLQCNISLQIKDVFIKVFSIDRMMHSYLCIDYSASFVGIHISFKFKNAEPSTAHNLTVCYSSSI